MVNKKPSTAKRTEITNLINRLDGYKTTFGAGWTNLNKAINNLGASESHWDAKYNTKPFKHDEGWKNYLEEDFEGSGSDDGKAEKNANDEADARIGGVSDVFSRSVVKFYADLIQHEPSNSNVKTLWNKLNAYISDPNLNDIEKDFIGKDPSKTLIANAKTKATTTTTGGGGTNALPLMSVFGNRVLGFSATETTTKTPAYGIGWKLLGFK